MYWKDRTIYSCKECTTHYYKLGHCPSLGFVLCYRLTYTEAVKMLEINNHNFLYKVKVSSVHKCTHAHTHTQTHAHAHMHACMHTCTWVHTQTHTHTLAHTCLLAHLYTHRMNYVSCVSVGCRSEEGA